MQPTSIALVDDDPLVRDSLATYLGGIQDFGVLLAAGSVEDFLQALQDAPALSPDVLLLDIQLPGQSGVAGIPAIRERLPDVDIIMLTTFEDSAQILAALCAGACSYLSKQASLADIAEAVRTVRAGGAYMSPGVARKVIEHFGPKPHADEPLFSLRQQEIIRGIMDGLSYKMIAARHDISLDTVRSHIMSIYRTLKINSKIELIRKMQGRRG